MEPIYDIHNIRGRGMTDRTRSWLGLVSAAVAFLAALFGGSYLLHQITTTWLLFPVIVIVVILLTLSIAFAYYHAAQLLEGQE